MLSTLQLTSFTPITRQQQKKISQILNYLIDNPQAGQFLNPVDWQQMQLNDYPHVIKHPMNLLKVQDRLRATQYTNVEEVLDHIQLVWDNCKSYNKEGPFFQLAEKMERAFKKMIKNYLPNIHIIVPMKNSTSGSNVHVPQHLPPPVQQKQPVQAKELPARSSISRNAQKNTQQTVKNVSPSHQQSYQQDSRSNKQMSELIQPPIEIQEIPLNQKNRFHQRLKQITQQQLAQIILIIQQNCSQAFKDVGGGRFELSMDSIDLDTFKKMNEKVDEFIELQKGNIAASHGHKKIKA